MKALLVAAIVSFAASAATGIVGRAAEVQAATLHVEVRNFAFAEKHTTVAAGDTVQWDFVAPAYAHTVTSSTGVFDSGIVDPFGPSFSYQFDAPGTYIYYCILHGLPDGSGMAGSVTVQAPTPTHTATVAAPTATPTISDASPSGGGAGSGGAPAAALETPTPERPDSPSSTPPASAGTAAPTAGGSPSVSGVEGVRQLPAAGGGSGHHAGYAAQLSVAFALAGMCALGAAVAVRMRRAGSQSSREGSHCRMS